MTEFKSTPKQQNKSIKRLLKLILAGQYFCLLMILFQWMEIYDLIRRTGVYFNSTKQLYINPVHVIGDYSNGDYTVPVHVLTTYLFIVWLIIVGSIFLTTKALRRMR